MKFSKFSLLVLFVVTGVAFTYKNDVTICPNQNNAVKLVGNVTLSVNGFIMTTLIRTVREPTVGLYEKNLTCIYVIDTSGDQSSGGVQLTGGGFNQRYVEFKFTSLVVHVRDPTNLPTATQVIENEQNTQNRQRQFYGNTKQHFFSHAYKGPANKNVCQIQGRAYREEEVIKSASGPRMHCTCGDDGQMKSDPKACSPEPMLRQMIAAAASRRRCTNFIYSNSARKYCTSSVPFQGTSKGFHL